MQTLFQEFVYFPIPDKLHFIQQNDVPILTPRNDLELCYMEDVTGQRFNSITLSDIRNMIGKLEASKTVENTIELSRSQKLLQRYLVKNS